MATTKTALITAISAELSTISGVKKVAYILELPDNARSWAPYIGIVAAGAETPTVVDTTHVRYMLPIELIVLYPNASIDTLIDAIRDVLLDTSFATTIGALDVRLINVGKVTVLEADDFSSTRIRFEVIYTRLR